MVVNPRPCMIGPCMPPIGSSTDKEARHKGKEIRYTIEQSRHKMKEISHNKKIKPQKLKENK
jgi:hypothetical protein